ncbi:MAG TPA: hypothetical protein DEQ50_06450 [Lactobacillus sp.]|nr:hypothetical protein [Lactobacillus sp.]
MRILKGYSKEEQKELEDAKKFMNCNDFINTITGNPVDTECGYIWDKYDKAEANERISIIRDILDFYTDRAKFKEPKKYYVHFIKGDRNSYLNIAWKKYHIVEELGNNFASSGWQNKFTREEVVAIDPRLVTFMEEVEDDEQSNELLEKEK